jgi:hypothetical protein
MSALHIYVLACDAPGCSARFGADLPRADQTRQIARGQGWVHGVVAPNIQRSGPAKSLNYCSEHVALAEGLVGKPLPQHAREVSS